MTQEEFFGTPRLCCLSPRHYKKDDDYHGAKTGEMVITAGIKHRPQERNYSGYIPSGIVLTKTGVRIENCVYEYWDEIDLFE